MLYEVLTGVPPFSGTTVERVLGDVSACRFDPIRRVDPSVPKAVEAVCKRAMAPAPADRYGSAVELGNDLRHWRAGEPVSAWKEPLTVRFRRWVGRHQTAVSIVAVSTVALVVTAGVAGYLLHRASVLEVLRRADAQRHSERLREQAARTPSGSTTWPTPMPRRTPARRPAKACRLAL